MVHSFPLSKVKGSWGPDLPSYKAIINPSILLMMRWAFTSTFIHQKKSTSLFFSSPLFLSLNKLCLSWHEISFLFSRSRQMDSRLYRVRSRSGGPAKTEVIHSFRHSRRKQNTTSDPSLKTNSLPSWTTSASLDIPAALAPVLPTELRSSQVNPRSDTK